MTINEALYGYLSGYAGLVALIATRAYSLVAPQNVTKPYVRFQRIDTPREYSHQGYSGLAHPRFQFSVFAETPESAKAVVDQVRTALQGYVGTMGGSGGVTVQAAMVVDERDNYEPDTKLYREDIDVILWHAET